MVLADIPDVYADAFQFTTGHNGCTMNFMLGPATPSAPGQQPAPSRVATVRVSLELAKVVAFAMRKAIRQYEQQSGAPVNISRDLLNMLHVSPEDWNSFWED